jgi:hypothetical protein
MAMPVGTWHIVTNLHCSTLEITAVDPQGKLTGTIKTNTNTLGTHNIPAPGTQPKTNSLLPINSTLDWDRFSRSRLPSLGIFSGARPATFSARPGIYTPGAD